MIDVIILAENINSFFAKSLETALADIGLKSWITPMRNKIVDEDCEFTSIIVIVPCDNMSQYSYAFQNLKDKCQKYDRRVISFGLPKENEYLMKVLGSDILIHEFERTMAPNELAKSIEKVCSKENKRRSKFKVMVIDDSGMTLRTMMEWLEDKYEVRVANSAKKAAPMIAEDKPDIILLDYEMPECSGADYFVELKEGKATSDIPVIFLTSKDDMAIVKSVIEMRPAGYVLKSTTKEVLIERIEEVLSVNI